MNRLQVQVLCKVLVVQSAVKVVSEAEREFFEIFVVNQEIEEMIYHNVSIVELRKKAREMGMRSMREDGFRKVLAGVTTLDEVLMVTTAEE